MRHTRDIARLARQSYTLAVDRETAVRGYLLTRNPLLLEPERRARGPLDAKLDSLARRVRVPAQRERVRRARRALDRWEREFAIPAMESGNVGARADALVGKPRFDALRHEFESFLAAEDALYVHGVRDADRVASWATAAMLAGLLLVGVALVRQQRGIVRQAEELLGQQQRLEEQASELEERSAQLGESNRELEAFSYAVAHDLRAPLRSIDGYARILRDEAAAALSPEHRGFLRRILANSRRMSQLIDGLLALARLRRDDVRRDRVDLSALAREVAADLTRAEPERDVRIEVQDGLAAQGDARLLEVVLRNLIGNAWKFTRDRAPAEIELRTVEGDPSTFVVRDNGAGFDGTDAERLFTPFTRLHEDNRFEGTGIGLATVRRIVERHGGRVWAEGAVDRGASVYFTLKGA